MARVFLAWEAFFLGREGPRVGVQAGLRRETRAADGRGSGTNFEGKDGPIPRYQSRCSSYSGAGAAASERQGKTACWQGQAAAELASGRCARAFALGGWVRSLARGGATPGVRATNEVAMERGKIALEYETGPKSLG